MKNNNFISFVTALVIGLVIGGGVTGLIWHNSLNKPSKDLAPKPGLDISKYARIKVITTKDKDMYNKEFHKSSKHYYWNLASMTIFKPQYDGMTYLLEQNSSLIGFRLTPGIVGDPDEVIVITGVDSTGNDYTGTPPVLTPVEPCPPFCDDTTSKPHN